MTTWIISYLLGTKLGRWAAGGLVSIGLILSVIWVAFSRGRAKERAKLKQRRKQIVKAKVKTDEKIRGMSPTQRRDRLNRWVRDGS